MKVTHNPLPWVVKYNAHAACVQIRDATGELVASMHLGILEQKANAKLIVEMVSLAHAEDTPALSMDEVVEEAVLTQMEER